MTTVLFIHSAGPQGPGEGSAALLESFRAALPAGLALEAPLMPQPDDPEAELWIAACQSAITGIEDELVLVGHSLGGSIILQTLARFGLPVTLKGVVTLAAPFWGAGGWDFDSFALPGDEASKLHDLPRLVMLRGEADTVVADDHLDRYKALLPNAEIARLPDVDHEAASAGPKLAEAVAALDKQA